MKRKFLALSLVLVLCIFGNTNYALAAENNTQNTISVNEYDFITMLTEASESDLQKMGMTTQDVKRLSTNYKRALTTRASMAENDLYNLGYTKDDVVILKKLAAGGTLSAAEQRAVSGTCVGDIRRISCNANTAQFKYTWEWDHCPLVTLNDSAAVRWLAFDENGGFVDVSRCDLDVYIKYYQGNTVYYNGTGSEEPGLDMYSVNIQFEMLYDIGSAGSAYAKNGEIYIDIELEDEVVGNKEISYIKIAGLYGHTTIGVNYPSISLSASGSIGISFSGNRSIDSVAGRKAKIGHNGIFEYLDE